MLQDGAKLVEKSKNLPMEGFPKPVEFEKLPMEPIILPIESKKLPREGIPVPILIEKSPDVRDKPASVLVKSRFSVTFATYSGASIPVLLKNEIVFD